MRTALALTICIAVTAQVWVLPAIGSDKAQSAVSLSKRVSRLESKLRTVQRDVRGLEATSDETQPTTFTEVTAPVSLIAPGVVPHWSQGQAVCPAGSRVTGGGIRWTGSHGDQPVVQSSAPEGNGWYAIVELKSVTTSTKVSVHAICAR